MRTGKDITIDTKVLRGDYHESEKITNIDVKNLKGLGEIEGLSEIEKILSKYPDVDIKIVK